MLRLISIHALREEGDIPVCKAQLDLGPISIHALREEGDKLVLPIIYTSSNFYPRPPRGGRLLLYSEFQQATKFLSTPSARRATTDAVLRHTGFADFYPRPPRGGRPASSSTGGAASNISIHALREEGDPSEMAVETVRAVISIHALREEGDAQKTIYPYYPEKFLSTPSARRATACQNLQSMLFFISIHALREEGDAVLWIVRKRYGNFYPRPPRGGRPTADEKAASLYTISIHALREEGDRFSQIQRFHAQQFLSTPSARRATVNYDYL